VIDTVALIGGDHVFDGYVALAKSARDGVGFAARKRVKTVTKGIRRTNGVAVGAELVTLVTNDGALKDGAIEGLVLENWLAGDPT
jgi:hypothetical protein